MSSGFDARVEARLIGLRIANDMPNEATTIIPESSNLSTSNENSFSKEIDNRSSLSDQSTASSMYNLLSSTNNNAPVTARR